MEEEEDYWSFECDLLYPPGPTMRTLAVRCDGKPTCSGKEDEQGCKGEWISFGWILVIILVLTVRRSENSILTIMIIFRVKNNVAIYI